jgi:hypothetical protein
MALDGLCEDELALRERVASLESDVGSYRALVLEAIDALHHITTERDRLRSRLRDALERQRERSAA